MITVSFGKEMREAFAAGERAAMSRMMLRKAKDAATVKFFAATPKSYEEWIESKRNDPQVMIG